MAIYLKPVMPSYSSRAEELFKSEEWTWDDISKTLENTELAPFQHLLQRVDPKKIKAITDETIKEQSGRKKEGNTRTTKTKEASDTFEALAPEINIDDFLKTDLRVALVKEAEHIEKAAKLLRLTLDLGPLGERQVFAGIKSAYAPEDLKGKLLVVVANLKPRKMKFGNSEGMILCAGPGGKDLWVVSPESGAKPGMRIG